MSGDGPTEERLKAALDAAADAVVVLDRSGSIVAFNHAAETLAGTTAADVTGLALLPLAAERGATGDELAILRGAFRDGRPGRCESALTRADGTELHVIVRASPILDAAGQLDGATLVVRRDEAGARTRFLADASVALSDSLDLEPTLTTLGDLVVPAWADVCVIALCDDSGQLSPVSLHHADPVAARLAERLFPVSGGPLASGRLLDVLEGGPRLTIEHFEAESLGHVDPGLRAEIQAAGLRSAIVVALRVRSQPVGVLCIATTAVSGRRLGETHGALFADVALRAAQAIDNARLFQAVRTAEGRFRAAFDHAPVGIALMRLGPDAQPRWAEVNPALCAIAGYAHDALVGRPVADFTHPDDRAEELRRMNWLVEGRVAEVSSDKRQVRADGEVRWVHVRAAPFEQGSFVAQIQDVTERRRFQDQLEHLASHDPLTSLLNRRRFEEELEQTLAHVLRHGDGAAVITLDLDNFKHVNDTYGHAVGDSLLRAIADALQGRVRTTDQVGRLGGDEFGVILPRTTPEAARTVARTLLEEVRAVGVAVGARTVRVTSSGGLRALGAAEARSAGDLLGEADMAMYDAKERGRDRLSIIRPGDLQPERVRARMRWSERIRDALANDGFVLFEQPILRLCDDTMDRSELLIRMHDGDGEPIGPGDFLPIAERYGQIRAIDRWVVRAAVALLAARRDAGIDLAAEVNLSGESITDAGVVDFVVAEIRSAGIDPTRLIFEVTETAAIGNLDRARRLARQLTELGCGFALDDFGAGFGSFAYLKHLPLDVIKIDGEFVRQLPHSRHDQITVKAIVDIARGLGKETVAEFVEDAETVALLRTIGVDRAQGFHVGRPRLATIRPTFDPVGSGDLGGVRPVDAR